MSIRKRAMVIGGGLCGLVAARELATHFDVTVLEQSNGFGGKLQTARIGNRPVDTGPDAFITRNDAAVRLCHSLELTDALVAPATSAAAIYVDGALRPFPKGLTIGIPTHLQALRRSGLVSPSGIRRAYADLVDPRRVAPQNFSAQSLAGTYDPSVGELVGKRLGHEIVELLVDPLIGGINASDVDQLSFAASLPQLVAMVSGKRSLTKALRGAHSRTASGGAVAPVFFGLRGGLSQLIDALVQDCRRRGVKLRHNVTVNDVTVSDGALPEHDHTWTLRTSAGTLTGNAVIVATPAFTASAILGTLDATLAQHCREISYASVATITLSWRRTNTLRSEASRMTSGLAGVLVPRRYGHLITAASFTSSKWPDITRPGEIVIRASVGRYGDERFCGMEDNELIDAVRDDLASVLDISEDPDAALVTRFEYSFPQYTVGHLRRVAEIETRASSYPGLCLAGAGYHGVGIPACVESGERAARLIATF